MTTNLLVSPSESDISIALERGDIPDDASELTILLLAYIRENEIKKFYNRYKKRLKSPVSRKILNELAKQKAQHQDILKAYYHELSQKYQMPISIDEIVGEYSLPISQLKRHADLFDVFQLALELEKKCHDFFEDSLDYIKNKPLAKAFKFLASKEKKYLQYLVNQFCFSTE